MKSISDGLCSNIFCRKVEKTRPMREEMDGKVVNSHQSRHFLFIAKMSKTFSIFVP